jgi:UDP-GlcNAc:undecaprenyl-phosphate GlcNAc-1-phosphate transferase
LARGTIDVLRALIAIFGISCVFSLLVNWVARGAARRLGLVDKPDGHRKLQSHAIPLAGGIAIFTVIVAVIGGLMAFNADWKATVLHHGRLGFGLLLSGCIIVVLGVADDAWRLRGRQKLLGQIVAAGVLVASGLSIERVQLLGMQIDLGLFAVPLTMFWLLGAINSLNLLDGIDGLAGTIGLVLSSALAVMAFMNGHVTIALVATIMAGSLVGFLRFNLPPATMYLGDAGSMLIGLAVGVMAIRASLKGPGTVMLAIPLALWTIPIFDTGAAILRRKLAGRSIYETDRAHLHHHLVQRIGHRMTLVCVGAVSLLTSAAALLSAWSKFDLIAILCAGLVVLLFISLRVFGHSELRLALVRARGFGRSLLFPLQRGASSGWQDAVRLQGTRDWELIWDTLTESAAKFDLVQLRLDVNVPVLGEGYNASWSRPDGSEHNRHWRFDTPLVVEGRVLGRLNVVGCGAGAAGQSLEQLTELVGEVESHLVRLVKPVTVDHAAWSVIDAQPPSESDTVVEMDVVGHAHKPARRPNGAGPRTEHGRN